jgi:hypothetical protein
MPETSAAPPHPARLGLALVVASAAAVATTRLTVHVPPDHAVLACAAAALTAALLAPRAWRPWAAFASAVIAAFAASHVLFRPGLPQVHDPVHVWGLWAYARAARAGHLLPMWLPDLGAGLPLLQFYGPVNFVLELPGILAGLAPVGLWKEAMLQAAVLSAIATLFGARLLGAGWRAASIAACAIAFSPWRLAIFNFRGALGEVTALVFAPLVAASALALFRRSSRAAVWTLGVAVALLIPTHLITLFCLGVVLVPALVAQELAMRREPDPDRISLVRRALSAAAPALLAAGIAAVWWVPALFEARYTSLPEQTENHHYFVYAEHGLGGGDLFARRAWDTLRASLKASDRAAGMEGKQMPFYVGAVLFGAALAAPFWSRSRATWGPACGAVAGLLFATSPAARLMTALPVIHKIQFPWRFLTVASVFAAYAIALGASALLAPRRRWARFLPVVALPALLIADAAPYTGAAGWVPPYHGVTHWVRAPAGTGEEPWDVAMRPVPVDWTGAGGLMRVGELFLPPDDLTTPVSLYWISYPEWMTPAVYHACLAARGPRDFADAGVVRYFREKNELPAIIHGIPYVTLERDGAFADAGPFTREPGRIVVHTLAPFGGARLIVREQAFPGWEARIDGAASSLAATPSGFMALDCPEGRHEIVLEYTRRTPARRAGIVVSALALCALLLTFRKRGGL